MTYDVVDVSIHFSCKNSAASDVHLYGSTHTQEYLVLRLELLRYNNNNNNNYHYAV